MTVTDDARAIAVWQKLQEAQTRLNEATKIMSYMFERTDNTEEDKPWWGPSKDACKIKQNYITAEDAEECEE